MGTAELFGLPTPCYVVDEFQLMRNLQILRSVSEQSGCKILLAQKAFSFYAAYPLIGRYLAGTEASGLYEARLGKTEMGGETHVFAAAYREDEFPEIASLCDHIVFNSFTQWDKFRKEALASGASCGIRVNPECSTQAQALYDPCAPCSRLGVTKKNFRSDLLEGIEGLHFHTLCEQGFDALSTTLAAVEENFGEWLPRMKWINFGGGHHITRPGYDISSLVERIRAFRQKYGITVYLEPGEAVALNAGVLVTRVLDVVQNGMNIAVLDASAACHMPDVLEMPYRPPLRGAGSPGEKPHLYRLAGPTCLAGDVIGDYTFDRPLQPGDTLVFEDMAIYTMVKNNTFNGIRLPGIYLREIGGTIRMIRTFGYGDFKNRLS
ncbi:MAG TPA: carboxynorspermidine decarboxylase [Candidatus Limiplasma sp.]|nr:carboxynorspermidine decarboxylase [Candidatus Limiplasma sp.]